MAHARITLQRAYDAVEDILATGRQPTDADIARWVPCQREDVRSILADLADTGRITIKGFGDERVISLGRARSILKSPTPLRTVKKAVTVDDDETAAEAAVEKIRSILARGAKTTPVRPAAARPVTAPRAPTAATPPVVTIAVEPTALPPAPPALEIVRTATTSPGSGKGRGWKEAKIATRTDRRQLNVHFPSERYDALIEKAEAAGETPSAWARRIVMAAMNGDQPIAATAKPIISAAMTAAALRDGIPVCDFIAILLARGFASHEHDASLERCA